MSQRRFEQNESEVIVKTTVFLKAILKHQHRRDDYDYQKVSCVQQHPDFNSRSLAYNVAVLKLAGEPELVLLLF